MFNLKEVRQDQKKRMMSVFVVDKWSRNTKDGIMSTIQPECKGSSHNSWYLYTFWDVLTSTVEEAVALTRK